MDLGSNAFAFGDTLLETHIEPLRANARSPACHLHQNSRNQKDRKRSKPAGLPKEWLECETQRGRMGISQTLAIYGHYLKVIGSWRKANIGDFSRCSGFDPVTIPSLEVIPESRLLRRNVSQSGIAERNPMPSRRHTEADGRLLVLIHNYLVHRCSCRGLRNQPRIDNRQTVRGRKPYSPVRRPRCRDMVQGKNIAAL